jgi:succinoglycan biosynthesis transport protein ExoP
MQRDLSNREGMVSNLSTSPPLGPPPGFPLLDDATNRLEPLAVPVGRFTSILRRRLWVVIAVFIVGVGMTATVVTSMPKKYTAETSILVEPQRTQVSDLQAISADPGDISTVVRTQIDILRSPTLAVNVVKALHLIDYPEFGPDAEGMLSKVMTLLAKMGLIEGSDTRQLTYENKIDIAAALLSTKIGFLNEARSGVLSIDVTTRDTELSAKIANEIANQYLDLKQQAKFAAVQRAHDWFQDQIKVLSEQLRRAELDVEHYRQEHRLDDESPNGDQAETRLPTINRQQLESISQELVRVARESALKEGQLEQAQLALEGKVSMATLPEVLVSPAVAQLLGQLATVQGREAQLTATQGAGNPELMAAKAQERRLRAGFEHEMTNVAHSLTAQVAVTHQQEQLLKKKMEQLRAAVSVENSAQVGLRALLTKERATRSIYQSFLTRATQLANVGGIQEQDASLVSRARPPLGPSAPRVTRILAVAAGLSLVLGVAMACVIDRLRTGFSVPEELESTLGLQLIGLLPRVSRRTLRFPTKGRAGISFTASLDKLRGQLLVMGDTRPKIIMVTSALPREGKSVMAAALARNAAAAGWRVLLVECDLRCPSLAAQFRIKPTAGLSDILNGKVLGHREDFLYEPEPGLHLITSGHSKCNAQEMLASRQMSEWLITLRTHYDLILLDTPPVLPVADALVLARYADTTLMVVQWEDTTRSAAQEALRLLRGTRTHIMGAVMTQIEGRTAAISGGRMSTAFDHRYDRYYGTPT